MRDPLLLAVCLAATLVLVTGVVDAAKRRYINGARIRPGSLTEEQVKPESLSERVLTPETRAAFGAPAAAVMATKGQVKVPLQGPTPVDVLTLQLPDGAWVVTGRLTALLSPTTTFVNCFVVDLSSTNQTVDFAAIMASTGTVVPLSVGAVIPDHHSGLVRFRCSAGPSDTSVATFQGVSLTALSVDSATGTVVPADS
jgi:hypothetical protein